MSEAVMGSSRLGRATLVSMVAVQTSFAEYTPWVTTLILVLRLARIVNHHAKIAHIQSALDSFVGCFFSIFLLGCCLFSFECCEKLSAFTLMIHKLPTFHTSTLDQIYPSSPTPYQ